MYRDVGLGKPAFYILLKVVTHAVCILQTGILGHYQVQVDITVAASLAGAQLVKIDHLSAEMLCNGGAYAVFLVLGQFNIYQSPE